MCLDVEYRRIRARAYTRLADVFEGAGGKLSVARPCALWCKGGKRSKTEIKIKDKIGSVALLPCVAENHSNGQEIYIRHAILVMSQKAPA